MCRSFRDFVVAFRRDVFQIRRRRNSGGFLVQQRPKGRHPSAILRKRRQVLHRLFTNHAGRQLLHSYRQRTNRRRRLRLGTPRAHSQHSILLRPLNFLIMSLGKRRF
jgi:hypothetical protein